MRIDCEQCRHQFELPDEKVPDQVFSLACPSCKNRVVVDPKARADQPVASNTESSNAESSNAESGGSVSGDSESGDSGAGQSGAGKSGASDSSPVAGATPPGQADTGALARLTPLRAADAQRMQSLVPVAYVANLDQPPDPAVTQQLQRLGMEEVRNFDDLEEACSELAENDAALLLVRMQKASAPPCEPLVPVYRLPFDLRRKTFVALLADNVKSLDGQVAFYLQVNCLLSSREMDTMAVKLRRALLHDLRLYRHWELEVV